ncbi:MAG: hypothetical protein LIP09_04920 [Bacteroidales bacterium]|nr:hypothetical protein [Bacteroidales bacterium]
MRKVIWSIVCSLLLALTVSCGNGIESFAKSRIEKVMRERMPENTEYKLSDFQTTYKTDSVCAIEFNLTTTNKFGTEKARIEYLLCLSSYADMESFVDLSNNKPILKQAEAQYKSMRKDGFTEYTEDDAISAVAIFRVCFMGSKIENEN